LLTKKHGLIIAGIHNCNLFYLITCRLPLIDWVVLHLANALCAETSWTTAAVKRLHHRLIAALPLIDRRIVHGKLTPKITGSKKQSAAALFAVRVNFDCWTKPLRGESHPTLD